MFIRRPALALLAAFCTCAAAHNPTNTVWLHVDHVSVNPFTLSLRWSNARIKEYIPAVRDALVLHRGDISISLWRILLLQTVYFTSFDLRGVDVRLLRHADGSFSPFHSADPTNLILAVASGSTSRFDRSYATTPRMKKAVRLDTDDDDAIPFVVPLLLVTNLNISCDDRDTRARLWSLDNMYFLLERFRTPLLHNPEPWRMALGAGCDSQTNKWFAFDARLLTSGHAPWARFSFQASRLRLDEPWLEAFTASHSAKTSLTARAEAHTGWFEFCYSNAWRTLWHAFDDTSNRLAAEPAVSNFFARAALSTIVCNANVDIVFTNRQLAPGLVDLQFAALQPTSATVRISLTITNAPPWLLPHIQ